MPAMPRTIPARPRVKPMLKLHTPFVMGAVLSMAVALPATAADWIPEPPVIEYPDPEPAPVYGGWYLRGHIGGSNQRFRGLENAVNSAGPFQWVDKGGFSSAPIFGGGVGYKVNDYLRLDGIVEYRGKSSFTALDRYPAAGGPGTGGTNEYSAKKSELLLMVNAYADLGEFHGVTPYIGAGIGASRNTISHFRDVNVPQSSVFYADKDSTWQLAWALHAGVGIKATDRMTIDLGYSYVHLGDGRTKDAIAYDGSSNIGPFKFKDLASHDFKVGVRYSLF